MSNLFLADEGQNMLDAWLHASEDSGDNMAELAVMATAHWYGEPPECSGSEVLIQNRTFTGAVDCVATVSLMAQTNVRISNGAVVRFISPRTTLGPGFSVAIGAEFAVLTSN